MNHVYVFDNQELDVEIDGQSIIIAVTDGVKNEAYFRSICMPLSDFQDMIIAHANDLGLVVVRK